MFEGSTDEATVFQLFWTYVLTICYVHVVPDTAMLLVNFVSMLYYWFSLESV